MSQPTVRDEMQLLRKFRLGLQSGAIRPHYQPEIDLHRPDWMGFEALSRWHDTEWGDISPGVFIPLAEKQGLLAELTIAQIRQLAKDACELTRPFSQVALALNLSPSLIEHEGVHNALLEATQACRSLSLSWEIEITETEPIGDFGRTREILRGWHHKGIRIVLDDFGTGWSNWIRTELLPVDRIKIDSSFVRRLDSMDGEQVLTQIRTRAMAQGIELTVEGVETRHQMDILRQMGFNRFQGWLFAKAMPLSTLMEQTDFFRSRL